MRAQVLINHYDSKIKDRVDAWFPCEIIGETNGDIGEDFMRVNVRLENGRMLGGCHPKCVRRIKRAKL